MSNETLKWYLPVFLLVYLFITFVLPSYRVYKQTGINPFTFGKSDSAHDYIGRLMKAVTGLLVAVVLLFSCWEDGYRYTAPVVFLEKTPVRVAGIVLLQLSLVWIIIPQYQMQQSWRIGIDANNPTKLVTSGLFRFSRNPVFLGMLSSLLGMFLVIPNALTLAIFFVSYCLLQIQIRLEEAFLGSQHGAVYQAYRKRVPRFL
ncbi:isoprenylcysteine carboxylmethyltransferase family protein [Flavisolibacter sp. BT320]|nr:isoprenylcysteine carboxylmethyltransferase family protein [Flavisolibacter longurius]